MYLVGVGLIVLGIVLFLIGRRPSRKTAASAHHGSVAIGGSALGPVTNINTSPDKGHGESTGHWITILAILVEVVGIAVTIWHAYHLASR